MNEIIAKTIAEARECLIDADSLIKMGRWKASTSRSYYSMYHSAKAALPSKGVEAYTHQGVITQFSKWFIKTAVFDKSLSHSFRKLFETRMVSDYEIGFTATEEDALHAYQEASDFHKTIGLYLLDYL